MPNRIPRSRLVPRLVATVLLSAAAAACDKPVAIGDINNIVVVAPDSVWDALEPQITASLEPRAFTVRDERIFNVAHAVPTDEDWGTLQHVRQILVIGEPADPWVAEALEEAEGPVPQPPALLQVRNVWAQNQSVTVLLLPPASRPEAAEPLLRQAGQVLVTQLERYARQRMFVSGVDSARADSLARTVGFSLLLPELYRTRQVAPGHYEFRNDNPDPSDLIRAIQVASRPRGEVPFTAEAAVEWRAELARAATDPPQVTEPGSVEARALEVNGREALQVQGVWSNPPGEWPAAGPFISRMVQCPERTYLVDTWLYAPGKPKYEYMVQLYTLLSSFRCGQAGAPA